MVIIFLTAVILYSHYKRTCARISGTWIIIQTEEGIPHFRHVTIKKEGLSLPFENGNPFKRES